VPVKEELVIFTKEVQFSQLSPSRSYTSRSKSPSEVYTASNDERRGHEKI